MQNIKKLYSVKNADNDKIQRHVMRIKVSSKIYFNLIIVELESNLAEKFKNLWLNRENRNSQSLALLK